MTTTTLRKATVEDIVQRLTGTPYASTAETALGWGMGPAQIDIRAAVDRAIAAGRVRVVDTRDTTDGRGVRFLAYVPEAEFLGPFTINSVSANGAPHTRIASWRALQTVLPILGRLADLGRFHSIEVLDRHGNDITFASDVLPLIEDVTA